MIDTTTVLLTLAGVLGFFSLASLVGAMVRAKPGPCPGCGDPTPGRNLCQKCGAW